MTQTITLSLEDWAEQLATAEDIGFIRALDVLKVSDQLRWTLQHEHNTMHTLRARLYEASERKARIANS